MKLLLLIFFATTLPVVIFLTALLYGGISNTVLKSELATSNVYDGLSKQLTAFDTEDATSREIDGILKNRLTASYLQEKTELLIDDSYNWITGKSTAPPTISFREIKEDILAQNPDILEELQKMKSEMQPSNTSWTNEYHEPYNAEFADNTNVFTGLVQSDFSAPIGQQLEGIKTAYNGLRLVHPVLIILLVLSLILLFVLNQTFSSRLRWIGASFIAGAIVGGVTIIFNSFTLAAMTNALVGNTNEMVSIFSPIVINMVTYFNTHYVNYQKVISGLLFLIGIGCYIGVAFLKTQPATPQVTKMKKNK
jgi:hypothetical protein